MSRRRQSVVSAEIALEVEEAVEGLCDQITSEEVSQILELEDSQTLENVCVAVKEIENWVQAIKDWPQDDDSLWQIINSDRLRSILTGAMIAATKGEKSLALGVGVGFCHMAAVKSAPISVASPGLLRCIIRLLEDKSPSSSSNGRGGRRKKNKQQTRRTQQMSDDSDQSEEEDAEYCISKRQKRGYDIIDLYAALCDWLASNEWSRHMAELERTDHAELLGRLAQICASRNSVNTQTALRALLSTASGTVARAVIPCLPETNGREIIKALVHLGNEHQLIVNLCARLIVDGCDFSNQKMKKIPGIISQLILQQNDQLLISFRKILIEKLLVSGKIKLRGLAVEVAARLGDNELKEEAFCRLYDKCPTVRCRAITCLSETWFPLDQLIDLVTNDPKQAVRCRALRVLSTAPPPIPPKDLTEVIRVAISSSANGSPSLRLAGVSLLGNWYLSNNCTIVSSIAFVDSALARASDASPAVASKVHDLALTWLKGCCQSAVQDEQQNNKFWQAADLIASSQRRLKALRTALRSCANNNNASNSNQIFTSLATSLLSSVQPSALLILEQLPEKLIHVSQESKERILVQRATDTSFPDLARAAAFRLLGSFSSFSISSLDPLALGPSACIALIALGNKTWRAQQIQQCQLQLPQVNAVRTLGALLGTLGNDEAESHESSSPQYLNAISTLAQLVEENVEIQNNIRAEAIAALGRACIPSNALTKQYVKKISREISIGSTPQIRITACLTLAELCIEHASICEPRLSILAKALTCDADVSVRRHAIILLARLVGRDFVKWRVDLAHRCFAALADSDRGVTHLVEAALSEVIIPKLPSLIITHFTALIFVLNGARCNAYSSSNKGLNDIARAAVAGLVATASITDIEINGDDEEALKKKDTHQLDTPRTFEVDLAQKYSSVAARRKIVYSKLLSLITPEAKIQIAAKISKDILAVAADDLIEDLQTIHSPAATIVADALHLLATDLLIANNKVNSSSPDSNGDDDDFDDDLAADTNNNQHSTTTSQMPAALVAARSRLLSKMSKKHLLEQILPILISLKANLEKLKSPILSNLMHTLRQILSKYGDDVNHVLSQDPHLALELEYDLKHLMKQNELSQQSPLPSRRRKAPNSTPPNARRQEKNTPSPHS